MFGASAGLNKPLMRNDTSRKSQNENRKSPNDARKQSTENEESDKSTMVIKNPLLRQLHGRLKCVVVKWIIHRFSEKNHDLDDLEMQVVRYKPEGLDALCKNTKFSRKELQIMYRGFKQECPTGIVNEDTFKEIYAQFFPQGDSSLYAHYVFNTFDQDNSGSISFEEFVMGLSVLARGSLSEKLLWTFNLYDINGDGIITKEEMLDIVTSIYDMMGRFTENTIEERTAKEHVDNVFQRMDLNKDGVISVEEFMDSCRGDDMISRSMAMFDTVL